MWCRRLSRRLIGLLAAGSVLPMLASCGTEPTPPEQSTTIAAAPLPLPVPSPSPSPSPSASPSPTAVARPLDGVVILVDPGHNGNNGQHPEVVNRRVDAITKMKPCDTTGTQTNAGYPEHAFNWDVAVRLTARLKALGARVVLTRTSDTGVGPCLTERAAIGNRSKATVAVSIHGDGAPASAHGFHVLEPKYVRGAPSTAILAQSHRLAVLVRDQMQLIQPPANYIGSDGVNPRDDMGGLNLSVVPKVLVECGNMRNATDAALMTSPAHRQRVADALAAALTSFVSTL